VTRGTDLRGSGRKGLTRAGGSTAAQIGRRGAMVVEQRSSRGHRQGGRGSSQRRCGAWGGVREFGGGSRRRFTVTQRRRSLGEGAEEEKGLFRGRRAFIAGGGGWQRRRELRVERWRSRGHGKAAAAAVEMSSAWSGGRRPDRETDEWASRGFEFFSNLSKIGSTLKIQNGCLILLQKFPIFACGSLGIL
jgi:hypothetical protein